MDSATQYDAGTEQYLTPNPSVGFDLPPFAWDERIIWAFNRGLANRGRTDLDVIHFLQTIGTAEGQAKFTVGFVLGSGIGADQAITDYSRFVAKTLHLFVSAIEEAQLLFDPNLVIGSIKVYLTAPDSAERAGALEQIAEYFDKNYPGAAAALRGVKLAGMALESFGDWLSTPSAVSEIAVAISGMLGEVLAALLTGIRPYLNDAEKLGRGIGYMVGQFVMWVIFDLLGFPFSVTLDLLETVIETGAGR
jgi:hypothetical protein